MSRSDIYRILDTNGDGTGTKNAIGNYASAATKFYIKPPVNQDYDLYRMIIHIADVGAFDAGKYGNNIELTNGIKVRISNASGVVLDLLDGLTVLTNVDWAGICYDARVSEFGLGDNYLHIRWTFAKSGQPLKINGENGEWLEVLLNDSFVDLVAHYFTAQGVIRATGSI